MGSRISQVSLSLSRRFQNYTGVSRMRNCVKYKYANQFSGEVTNEAEVLEWALLQAGIKIKSDDKDVNSFDNIVEDVMEEIDDMLTFPGAHAEAEPAPEPKAEPSPSKQKEKPQKIEEEATPEPLSEIVDIIKNDNNVVVFFCKYSSQS